MQRGRFFIGLLAILPTLAVADVAVPDTPAGHALSVWLNAFNRGDPANPQVDMQWRSQVSGYDLLEIYSSNQTSIFFHLKPKQPGPDELGKLKVDRTKPTLVTELGTWRMVVGARFEAVTLDATGRAKLVERVARLFNDLYVYPDVGKNVSDALRKRRARGEYRDIIDAEDFAKKLSGDLRDVSHDKHAEVRFSYLVQPPQVPNDSKRLAAINCGFETAEHLPNNVGYLKFNMFADPQVCSQTASAAMTFLADSDALIIDLRDNNGGSGAMVEFIASYLFAGRTHLNDIYRRPENVTAQSWTLPNVPGRRFIGRPVYVLTSKRTFSAAEDLADALKSRKRATLVGDVTGGGAHPVDVKPLDDHFTVIVPTGRSIDSITGGDWEGVGVQPDVLVEAAHALEVATKLATHEH
ncbi:MAG: S41 family peptidase [Proteobacteria bacterium]|nr:S41 family peptidase [Pseudomonadota bacterium]